LPIRICKGSDRKANGERKRKEREKKKKKGGERKRKIGIGNATTGFGEPRVYIFIRATRARNRDAHIVREHRTPSRVTVTTRKKEEDARGVTRAGEKPTEDFKMRAHAHAREQCDWCERRVGWTNRSRTSRGLLIDRPLSIEPRLIRAGNVRTRALPVVAVKRVVDPTALRLSNPFSFSGIQWTR